MKIRILVVAVAMMLALSVDTSAQRRAPSSARSLNPVRKDAAQNPTPQQLPLRRVVLYSNGVAYFERRGTVSGRAEINLAFKQSQVDDVLKSMVVLDLGQGQVGAVSYNSSAPRSARLADIPFSIEAGTDADTEGGLAGVLRQLQGARVVVQTGNRIATGAILTVAERRSETDDDAKPSVTTHTLVIAAETGEIASFDLREVRSVRLVDEGARRDVVEFANASASARRRDAKTIVITSDGSGAREMIVSYTVAAPIWKTTYRVVLDASGQPFFQGWAIVDNVGDEDWADVALSLVSGTPVSFIQPLQQPLYRYRPVIPIPDDLNLDPQVYEPRSVYGSDTNIGGGGPGGGGGGGVGMGAGAGSADYNRTFNPKDITGSPTTSLSDAITSEDSGIKTAATGKETGDLFEYRIDRPVTVRRDRSALIPILQTRMEGERVSIYKESAQKERPMSGLLLKNTSPLTLEGGALTVIEGNAYAGEALMERLKPNEERFISFAVDLATLVTVENKEGREPVFLVRVINGVFQAHYYQSEKKTYTMTNQTDKPRVVYVEHPLRKGWRLSEETPRPVEKTASVYRFRVELPPRQSVALLVAERRTLMDSYALSNLTPGDLELFISRRYLDEVSRQGLEKILEIKGRIASVDARVAAADKEAAEIAADQARLRENIKALNETSEARALIARYVAKAGEQETRIEQLANERRAATQERARLQAELDASVRALALDRRL